MGRFTRGVLLLAACGGFWGCGGDDCVEEERQWCMDLVPESLAPEGCCGDLAIDEVCVDGEWQCPEGSTRECRGSWLANFCADLER